MFTISVMKCRRIGNSIFGYYWVDLTDEAREGEWRWVNGELVLPNQTFWKSG